MCDALALLDQAKALGPAAAQATSYGRELLQRLDLRSFPSSLRPRLGDNFTLAAIGGAVPQVETHAVTLETADWRYRFEVIRRHRRRRRRTRMAGLVQRRGQNGQLSRLCDAAPARGGGAGIDHGNRRALIRSHSASARKRGILPATRGRLVVPIAASRHHANPVPGLRRCDSSIVVATSRMAGVDHLKEMAYQPCLRPGTQANHMGMGTCVEVHQIKRRDAGIVHVGGTDRRTA